MSSNTGCESTSARGSETMPRKPKRPCAYPGCPNLTDEQYCEQHRKYARQQYDRYERSPHTASKCWMLPEICGWMAHPLRILSFSKGQAASGITVNGKAVQRNVGVSIPLRPPFRRHGACSMRAAQLRSLIFHLPSRKFLMSISPRRTAITPCLWSEAVRVAGLQRPTPERYLP